MKLFQTLFSNQFIFLTLILFISCGEDEQNIILDDVKIIFAANTDDGPLEFDSKKYTTTAGNEISINRIKLYISDIQLINSDDNSRFEEIDSYHLVSLNADNPLNEFSIKDVPRGFQYDQIKFAIGVDSDKNFSLDNTGDLDPANDMAWNWDTGYKFFLMEGSYFPTDGSDTKGLIIHIGHDKNYRKIKLDLGSQTNTDIGNITFVLDALAPFNGPNIIDLTTNSSFRGQATSDVIAENYATNLIKSFTIN